MQQPEARTSRRPQLRTAGQRAGQAHPHPGARQEAEEVGKPCQKQLQRLTAPSEFTGSKRLYYPPTGPARALLPNPTAAWRPALPAQPAPAAPL